MKITYKKSLQTLASYDDAVCYSYYPIDLHKNSDEALQNIYIDDSVHPTLPLAAMVVEGLSNLMVSGRCISGDRLANSAFRVKASCMAMGEAVGTAAALCTQRDISIRELPIDDLRSKLCDNGAIVPLIVERRQK